MIVIFWIYLGIVAAMSLVTFFTYLADKIKAKNGAWRISEAALLGLSFFGGATGALIAMGVCRHKTRHWYFWAFNIFFILLHVTAGIVTLVYTV